MSIETLELTDNGAESAEKINSNFSKTVIGAENAVNNAIVVFSGTSGKEIKDSSSLVVSQSSDVITLKPKNDEEFALKIQNDSDYNIEIGNTTSGAFKSRVVIGAGEGGVTLEVGSSNKILLLGKTEIQNTLILKAIDTPASASAAGEQGQIAIDSNYIYVCTATNTWKRAALTTW
jgi:hypothetical protein